MDPNGQKKYKIAISFAIEGELKYLSHRDTMTLWQRALVRAKLPLRYSCGFNPHLRIALPLPRSVGMSSRRELLYLELLELRSPEQIVSAVQDKLPPGINLLAVENIDVMPQPVKVNYQLRLSQEVNRDQLGRQIAEFNDSDSWVVQRPPRGRHPARSIDLRESMIRLQLQQEQLFCTVQISSGATGRIDELLNAIKIGQPGMVNEICRIETEYC